MNYNDIKNNRRLKKCFRTAFNQALYECNEILIGKVSTDYIINRFEIQGYWSGVKSNIFFTPELGFESESRFPTRRN